MWEIIENAKSKLCQLGRKNENKENKKGEISGRRPKSDDLKLSEVFFPGEAS